MFGWLYVLFGISGKIGRGIKGAVHDAKAIEKANNTFGRTYYDYNGKDRYVDNGRWVHVTSINGDRVLEDVENKEVYINYSEEIRIRKIEDAKNNAIRKGSRAYLFKTSKERVTKKDNIPFKGDLYKDVNNDHIYAVLNRYVNNKTKKGIVELYIDIDTGLFVGKTDNQISLYDNSWKEKMESYIDDAISHIETISSLKGWTEEKYDSELEKSILKRREHILSHYIPDDNMDDYLTEINQIQKQYYANHDDLAYYSFKRRG